MPSAGWRGFAVFLLGFALLAGRAEASEIAHAYGESFVREGAAAGWAEAQPSPVLFPPLPADDTLPTPADVATALATLQAQVALIERAEGPYGYGLREELLAMAVLLRRSGDRDGALAAYRRALHVLRVNEGLYSPAQRLLVRDLLALQRARADFAALDGQYDYFFRIHGLGQPPLEGDRLGAALEYLRWQREALRRELGDRDTRMLALYQLNMQMLDRAWAAPTPDLELLAELTFSQIRTLHLLEYAVAPFQAEPSPFVMREAPRRDINRPNNSVLERLISLGRTSYPDGRRLLERLLDAQRSGPAATQATTLRVLGDWHQWHELPSRADPAYREAIALLTASGDSEQVQRLWGEPLELPDGGLFYQPENEDVASWPRVRATFGVSRYGRSQRVRAETLEGRSSASIVVARGLRAVAFRPRYLDGQPVDTAGLERDYRVLP